MQASTTECQRYDLSEVSNAAWKSYSLKKCPCVTPKSKISLCKNIEIEMEFVANRECYSTQAICSFSLWGHSHLYIFTLLLVYFLNNLMQLHDYCNETEQ